MSDFDIDPIHWSADTIAALDPDVIHDLAIKSSAASSSYRLVTGRCLLAVERNKIYLEMGYSGAIHYGVQVLRLSKSEARMLRLVALRLESLPRLTKAAKYGQVSWTALRSIVKKATIETEEFWLQIAARKGCDEIESLATATEYGKLPWDANTAVAPPTTKLQLNLSEETGELLTRVTQNLSQELGKPLSASEVLEHLAIEKLAKRPLSPQAVEATRKEARRGCAAARRRHAQLIQEARQVALECGLGSDSGDAMAIALGTVNPVIFADDRPAPLPGVDELLLSTLGEAELLSDGDGSQWVFATHPGRDSNVDVDTQDATADSDAKSDFAGANPNPGFECERPGRDVQVHDNHSIDRATAGGHQQCGPADCRHADCGSKADSAAGFGWRESTIAIDLLEAPGEESKPDMAAMLASGELDQLLAAAKLPPDTDPRAAALIDRAIKERRVVLDLDDESWKNPRVKFNAEARFVTPAQRKELLRRDGYCCRTPGCPNHLWLDMHHIVYVSHNGKTLTLNLISLCWRCHRNVHDGFLVIEGDADRGLIFRNADGRDLELAYQTEFASWLNLHIGWSGGPDDFHRPKLALVG